MNQINTNVMTLPTGTHLVREACVLSHAGMSQADLRWFERHGVLIPVVHAGCVAYPLSNVRKAVAVYGTAEQWRLYEQTYLGYVAGQETPQELEIAQFAMPNSGLCWRFHEAPKARPAMVTLSSLANAPDGNVKGGTV